MSQSKRSPSEEPLTLRVQTRGQLYQKQINALKQRISDQSILLHEQGRILLQLSQITSECESSFPEYTQRVPTVEPGESPLVAVVRHVVKSLGDRVEEVEFANERARMASRAKDHFLATMSHEIRTPMNGLIGMIELLANTDLDEGQGEFVTVMRDSANSLLTLLNDILDFSKLSASQMQLEKRVFRPEKSIEEAMRTFAANAEEKGVELKYKISDDFPALVSGDGSRIRQVLSNLISNALKFTDQGSVRIDASVEGAEDDRLRLIFKVTDTGIGMTSEELAKVFAPFTQADTSTSRKFGGSGLGLTISRELLDLMQGTLSAESTSGVGSCFTMQLMVHRPKDVELRNFKSKEQRQCDSPFQLAEAEKPSDDRKLLLVEDNPVNQRVAHLTLEKLGYNVTLANNGYEAIARAKEENFEWICMDVSMPGIDGYETTQKIRELDASSSNAWIVAMTGHAFEEDRIRCIQAGMNDFVPKPFTVDALRNALTARGLAA
ncbi:MAG: ATP-binding protein [Verrucomicrobiota bacterium]